VPTWIVFSLEGVPESVGSSSRCNKSRFLSLIDTAFRGLIGGDRSFAVANVTGGGAHSFAVGTACAIALVAFRGAVSVAVGAVFHVGLWLGWVGRIPEMSAAQGKIVTTEGVWSSVSLLTRRRADRW
jgi:hypothetical protein